MGTGYADCLRTSLDNYADLPAISFPEESLTYSELAARLGGVVHTLKAAGLQPGEVLALYTCDKRALLLADLAAIVMGAISLPLNERFTEPEMQYYLDDSGAALALTDEAGRERLQSAAPEHGRLRAIITTEQITSAPPAPLPEYQPQPTDPAFILYSSGTTGQPKAVLHCHDNLAAAAIALRDTWQICPDDRLLNCLPFYHIHGLSFCAHMMLLSGAEMLVQPTFHPRHTLAALVDCTVLFAIPTFYYSWLDHDFFRATAPRLGGVRLFTAGSAPIRPEVLPELEEILGSPITNRYGMTESHVITSLPLGVSSLEGSCGVPLPGITMRIVDSADSDLPAGQTGQILIKGPNLFREYRGRPEATAEAFSGGWFHTGDLGRLDEAGYLHHAGRCQEMIITSGHNVYPPMVEKVINALPGVKESAVFGLPHKRRGEVVAVAVVRADHDLTEDHLRAWCAERMVDYAVPNRVIFVEELPRNAMSKVLKRQLQGCYASQDGTE